MSSSLGSDATGRLKGGGGGGGCGGCGRCQALGVRGVRLLTAGAEGVISEQLQDQHYDERRDIFQIMRGTDHRDQRASGLQGQIGAHPARAPTTHRLQSNRKHSVSFGRHLGLKINIPPCCYV